MAISYIPPSVGMVPIGGVVAWFKSITGVPSLTAQFTECNGQTLSDPTSPLNGQVIPDLNGFLSGAVKRFLRGGGAGDGATSPASDDGTGNTAGGSETHQHATPFICNYATDAIGYTTAAPWGTGSAFSMNRYIVTSGAAAASVAGYNTSATSTPPSYYETVWVMRIK